MISAALLLMTMTEEDTFWMLVTLLYDSQNEINMHNTGLNVLNNNNNNNIEEKKDNNSVNDDNNENSDNSDNSSENINDRLKRGKSFGTAIKYDTNFRGYQLRGLYLDGLPLLHLRYFQFKCLLKEFFPKIDKHLVL